MGEVSDSDDDDDDVRRPVTTVAGGKNRVLYEAATRRRSPERSAPAPLSRSGTSPLDIKKQRSPSPPGYTPQAAPTNAYEKPSPGPGMSIRVPPPASQDSQQPLLQPLRSMARSPMPAPVPQHAHSSPARPVPAS
ncbi:hypothetical protein BS47DRAFT_1132410 [Hydnum rufescens UP504]|uniref:Uncharacterized protein n=1 Tax=Hydnum rufescens UP504 TaxID=1448309 RepID=A0A9P6AUB4_9AGAM|nr:hypothetical protein BS47DRAFT_1132410 [Hydnum rufescens UP504]